MCLARLIATVSLRCAFAELPVILLGRILPLSEIFLFNLLYNDIRVIKYENNNIKYEYVSISDRWKFQ